MRSRFRCSLPLLVLLSFALPSAALAQKAPPPTQEFTAELAFVGTSGNSSANTFSAGAEHIARPDGWLFKNVVRAIRSTSEGDTTAESLLYGFRAEHVLTARLSAIGEYGFFRDKPSGVSSRNTVTGGLAFKVADGTHQSFVADGGIGYLNEQRLSGSNVSSATYNAGSVYKLKLSDTADLTDEARLLGTFSQADDWRVTHSIAVTARLNSRLMLKVSNLVRYAHFPPPGFRTTDTTTSVALVVSFKRQ